MAQYARSWFQQERPSLYRMIWKAAFPGLPPPVASLGFGGGHYPSCRIESQSSRLEHFQDAAENTLQAASPQSSRMLATFASKLCQRSPVGCLHLLTNPLIRLLGALADRLTIPDELVPPVFALRLLVDCHFTFLLFSCRPSASSAYPLATRRQRPSSLCWPSRNAQGHAAPMSLLRLFCPWRWRLG